MINVLGGKKGDKEEREVYLIPFLKKKQLLKYARKDVKINLNQKGSRICQTTW